MDYELDTCSRDLSTNFTLGEFLFGAVKLTSNFDPNKYGYSDKDIGFDACSQFSLPNGKKGKNVNIIFFLPIILSTLFIVDYCKKISIEQTLVKITVCYL